jgi:hypothetical protein
MSGNTATPAIMLAAGALFAGLASVLAAEPPATLAEPAHTEKAESGASPTRAKACPAWWLTTPTVTLSCPKRRGQEGPTPEHKGRANCTSRRQSPRSGSTEVIPRTPLREPFFGRKRR